MQGVIARHVRRGQVGTQLSRHHERFALEAAPREPVDAGARRAELCVSLAIALERRARAAVKAPGVELDDHPLCAPERVDHEALDMHVRLRHRERLVAAEMAEAPLELRAHGGRLGRLAHQGTQGADAAAASGVVAALRNGPQLQQVQAVGLLEGVAQAVGVEHSRQVHEGPGEAGDGDAVADCAVAGRQ